MLLVLGLGLSAVRHQPTCFLGFVHIRRWRLKKKRSLTLNRIYLFVPTYFGHHGQFARLCPGLQTGD